MCKFEDLSYTYSESEGWNIFKTKDAQQTFDSRPNSQAHTTVKSSNITVNQKEKMQKQLAEQFNLVANIPEK